MLYIVLLAGQQTAVQGKMLVCAPAILSEEWITSQPYLNRIRLKDFCFIPQKRGSGECTVMLFVFTIHTDFLETNQ